MKITGMIKFCLLVLLCTYVFDYSKIYADEIKAKEMIVRISKCKAPMVPVTCTIKYFNELISELDKNNDLPKSLVVYLLSQSIFCSNIPVIDKDKKLLCILQFINEGKVTVNDDIIQAILPMIDSREDERVFEEAALILLNNTNFSISNDVSDNDASYRLEFKFKGKKK